MKIGELARHGDVTHEAIRHYVHQGLIHAGRDPNNGYQYFDEEALRRVRFIQRARTLGFSLREVGEIFAHTDHGDSPCPMVRDLLSARLPQIRAQIRELEQLADRMEHALQAWSDMPDGAPDGHTLCQLIEHWNEPDTPATTAGTTATGRPDE
ncbi:MerR family transcriptional regulator [Kushneria indalinina]|uniref:DNA-binding transcriptional MerR regulator n=1 Tax=Kushneria indalinina DSM 14324 TaxID=1122140 RepID=A0A3D9DUE9_9GAMM|nr:MerR family DNA-binding protein [Kushneria indalinina]REC94019.1 DNA-binding transcriptional MerR regulator [Kushneria indalinina DSM 14324]